MPGTLGANAETLRASGGLCFWRGGGLHLDLILGPKEGFGALVKWGDFYVFLR